jgi:hypothetical protein
MEKYIVWPLNFLFGLLVGYLWGYIKKKAENRAMKEDIAALTRTAEEIKATIADKSWDRQRHWEMKRDAILAMIQALGLAREALMYMAGTYQKMRAGKLPAEHSDPKARELSQEWLEKMNDYDKKRFVAAFFGGKDLEDAMRTAKQSMRSLGRAAVKGLPYYMDTDMPIIQSNVAAVQTIAKRELGLEGCEPD